MREHPCGGCELARKREDARVQVKPASLESVCDGEDPLTTFEGESQVLKTRERPVQAVNGMNREMEEVQMSVSRRWVGEPVSPVCQLADPY